MRICHCVQVAPNRCGLYGTARDLITAEQMAGMEAGLIDANLTKANETILNGKIEGYPKISDPLIPPKSEVWAKNADVYIRHSFIPVQFQNTGKPLVMAIHGRPESSFRLEAEGKIPVISELTKRAQKDDRYKAFITFWPEYYYIWSSIISPKKLFYVPAPVDLNHYKPGGKKYDFGEHAGNPNILIADIWREDALPFNTLFSASLFQQKYCKTAKIHILALDGKNLLVMSHPLAGVKKSGALGIVTGHIKEIKQMYAAADIVVTPHVIATRIVRESLACGVPIVAGAGNRHTPFTANPMDIEAFAKAINFCWTIYQQDPKAMRSFARKTAEASFHPEKTGKTMKKVMENL